MADTIPVPAPASPAVPPPLPAPAPVPVADVQPTSLQVLSATVQNLAVIGVLGYGWILGKLDTTVAVVALLLVVGIDFANRRRLPTAGASAAVAFGATGILHAIGVTGTLAAAVLALVGCAGQQIDLSPAKKAVEASRAAYVLACQDPPADRLVACNKAFDALSAAITAYNAAEDIAEAQADAGAQP